MSELTKDQVELIKSAAEDAEKILPGLQSFHGEDSDAFLESSDSATGFAKQRIIVPAGGLTLADSFGDSSDISPDDLDEYETEQMRLVDYLELVSPVNVLAMIARINELEKVADWLAQASANGAWGGVRLDADSWREAAEKAVAGE